MTLSFYAYPTYFRRVGTGQILPYPTYPTGRYADRREERAAGNRNNKRLILFIINRHCCGMDNGITYGILPTTHYSNE